MKKVIVFSALALLTISSVVNAEGFGFGAVLKHGKKDSKICIRDMRGAYPIWYMGSFHKSNDKLGAIVADQYLGKEVDQESKDKYEEQCMFTELRDGRWEKDSYAKVGEYQVFILGKTTYNTSFGSITEDENSWVTVSE